MSNIAEPIHSAGITEAETLSHFRIREIPPEVAQAAGLLKANRVQAIAAFNAIFRSGTVPAPDLDGALVGGFVAATFGTQIDAALEFIVRLYLPWLGKTFDASSAAGDNIFTPSARLLGRIFMPQYQGYVPATAHAFRAFRFRSYVGQGLEDPDRSVLKIDYDLPENPQNTVRRVLDELVQVSDRFYLGKAHFNWWWGDWQRVAFFTLARVR